MTPETFRALALTNPINATILDRLLTLGLEQAYLVAGCLYQAVWNASDGRAPGWGVKDYDLFYYDADTSWEAEDAAIQRAAALFADLGVEVELRNQARVHLWYPQRFGKVISPLASSQDGIAGFLVRCTCVGLSATGEVVAPYGLEELAAGILSPNPRTDNPAQYRVKVDSYRARWPWLIEQG
jgi:hypothetical protein